MHVVETLKLKNNKTLEIVHDEDAHSPRDWDNLTKMVCFHRRYNLGDVTDSYIEDDYSSWDELYEDIMRRDNPLVIKPLYMYDHSGITISTEPFSCSWDSGQIGYVFITPNRIEELGTTRWDDEPWFDYIKRLEGYLKNEVKTYDDYVTGDVYGYRVVDQEGNEEDSCWGYYGSDLKENGILDEFSNQLENIDDL
jgi:hypothetical protein